jgi:hypothetical protein
MAPYTYYYCFSIVLFFGVITWLANLILLRMKGRTTFGQVFKPGTTDYKKIIKLASYPNLIAWTIIGLFFAANLTNSARRLDNLKSPSSHDILMYAPIVIILFMICMLYYGAKQFNMFDKKDK